MCSMWDFTPPEDELSAPVAPVGHVEFRPNRMALGCSPEMVQEKISSNAKTTRLEKLLKRKGLADDGLEASLFGFFDDDNTISKSDLITSPSVPVKMLITEKTGLSKSQRKRQKQNLKNMQKKFL